MKAEDELIQVFLHRLHMTAYAAAIVHDQAWCSPGRMPVKDDVWRHCDAEENWTPYAKELLVKLEEAELIYRKKGLLATEYRFTEKGAALWLLYHV